MDSSRTRIVTRRSDPAKKNISSRPSFSSPSSSFSSSSSSSSLVFPDDSPLNSPATPLRLLGVPFSWEHLPGKPKDSSHRLNNESSVKLPLPPHRSTTFPVTCKNHKTKKNSFPEMEKDPFAAALLECSKDDDEAEEEVDQRYRSSKALVKSSIDRFGLVTSLYGSCRRTCAVSESIVYLPRQGKATSYDHPLLQRRRR